MPLTGLILVQFCACSRFKLAEIQTQACRQSQYDSNSFTNTTMRKYNMLLMTCTCRSDDSNVLEEISLLFEEHGVLALGIQMLYRYIHI